MGHSEECKERQAKKEEELHRLMDKKFAELEAKGVGTAGRGYGWGYECTCSETQEKQ